MKKMKQKKARFLAAWEDAAWSGLTERQVAKKIGLTKSDFNAVMASIEADKVAAAKKSAEEAALLADIIEQSGKNFSAEIAEKVRGGLRLKKAIEEVAFRPFKAKNFSGKRFTGKTWLIEANCPETEKNSLTPSYMKTVREETDEWCEFQTSETEREAKNKADNELRLNELLEEYGFESPRQEEAKKAKKRAAENDAFWAAERKKEAKTAILCGRLENRTFFQFKSFDGGESFEFTAGIESERKFSSVEAVLEFLNKEKGKVVKLSVPFSGMMDKYKHLEFDNYD
jgi:hypothetical protein